MAKNEGLDCLRRGCHALPRVNMGLLLVARCSLSIIVVPRVNPLVRQLSNEREKSEN